MTWTRNETQAVTGPRLHGGSDHRGEVRWDFSTCANAVGPCPAVLARLQDVDPTRYPDPQHTGVRERLAAFHGVAVERIVLAASASEFIQRITAVGARLAPGAVCVPTHAYGDYAHAAQAWGRDVVNLDGPGVGLRWWGEPSSPLGQDMPPPSTPGHRPTVLDAVYAPLRLHGEPAWTAEDRAQVFELHSPNKALGLCGVRGAYAIAPAEAAWPVAAWCDMLRQTEPSWPLSAHAVAMLQAWTQPQTQDWLNTSRQQLRAWKTQLLSALHDSGAEVQPSVTNFVCVRWSRPWGVEVARAQGVLLRDASSFGLPGWWRVSVQRPAALAQLLRVVHSGAKA